jgi:hypothetical protein
MQTWRSQDDVVADDFLAGYNTLCDFVAQCPPPIPPRARRSGNQEASLELPGTPSAAAAAAQLDLLPGVDDGAYELHDSHEVHMQTIPNSIFTTAEEDNGLELYFG